MSDRAAGMQPIPKPITPEKLLAVDAICRGDARRILDCEPSTFTIEEVHPPTLDGEIAFRESYTYDPDVYVMFRWEATR